MTWLGVLLGAVLMGVVIYLVRAPQRKRYIYHTTEWRSAVSLPWYVNGLVLVKVQSRVNGFWVTQDFCYIRPLQWGETVAEGVARAASEQYVTAQGRLGRRTQAMTEIKNYFKE